jgi:hypothetical protein
MADDDEASLYRKRWRLYVAYGGFGLLVLAVLPTFMSEEAFDRALHPISP